MKTRIIIGNSEKKSEIKIKEYASGTVVAEFGDAENIIVGEEPIVEKKFSVPEKDKRDLFENTDNFKFTKGKLVRKEKKQ